MQIGLIPETSVPLPSMFRVTSYLVQSLFPVLYQIVPSIISIPSTIPVFFLIEYIEALIRMVDGNVYINSYFFSYIAKSVISFIVQLYILS